MLGDYRIKRDHTNNYTAKNAIYDLGLPIYETNTNRLKIGDGQSHYNDLYQVGYAGTKHMIEYDQLAIPKDTSGTGEGNEVFLTSSTIIHDDSNVFEHVDTSHLKILKSGIYWLSSKITLSGNVDAELRLYLNGTQLTAQDFVKSTTGLSRRNIRFTFMEWFNEGDIISASIVNYDTDKDGSIQESSIGFAMKVV